MTILYMYDPALDEYLWVRFDSYEHAERQFKVINSIYPPMRMFIITR